MNQLKKLIINAAMEKFDKIYIHALPHNKLIVGERGLINTEKNNGIVLAIGSSSCSELKMEDDFIPYEAVDAVLNDLHKPLCIFNFPYYEENNENVMRINKYTAVPDKQTEKKRAVIVKPDFTKK